MEILRPPKLKRGDLIGIVSPASPIADHTKLERGVRYLESLGYSVVVGANVYKAYGYLAGSDDQRVKDLHAMFKDKRVGAILCARGGYGTPRLLPLLNYRLISRNPKILVGFSDVTALLLAIWKKCRLITFHGPMLGVDMFADIDTYTEELFWRVVTSSKKIGDIPLTDSPSPKTVFPGKATGRLLGGNLSMICSILGTPYQPDFTNAALFVEETDEEPYRIDRMLTQLRNASILTKATSVLMGQFSECLPKDPSKPSLTLDEIFAEASNATAKPFLSNLPFGHERKKMTLPVGLKVSVDATSRRLSYLESAVE